MNLPRCNDELASVSQALWQPLKAQFSTDFAGGESFMAPLRQRE